ncbi:hypothetical protein QJS10_CPB04g01005 [Acorus calamus]|uniref:Uncharacterized protein n=1 Tax=Acorus calamus TaxID=4465 RepID=A0AAV9EZR8_ACOCL|nr:hypothetical protein QJS10_CPB04g01005 [Acorus calamus]
MSWIWRGMLQELEEFSLALGWRLGEGMCTKFWQDVWIGCAPLKLCFPAVFKIARYKQGGSDSFLERQRAGRVLGGQVEEGSATRRDGPILRAIGAPKAAEH